MTLVSYLIIFFIQTILSGIVAIISFYRYPLRDKLTKLIGLLFLVGFICNSSGYLLARCGLTRFINIPGSIYDFALVVIISVLYNHQTKGRYAHWFKVIVILFILFAFINFAFFQKQEITSYNKLLSSFLAIFFTLFYFYRLIVELPTDQVHKLPMFWFNAAFLIYHAGTIFLFAFTVYITDVLKNDLLIYWSFHNILSIVEHFIVLIGLSYDLRGINTKKAR